MIQPAFRKRDPAAPLATTIRPRSTLRSVRRAGTPVSNFARVQGRNRRATRGGPWPRASGERNDQAGSEAAAAIAARRCTTSRHARRRPAPERDSLWAWLRAITGCALRQISQRRTQSRGSPCFRPKRCARARRRADFCAGTRPSPPTNAHSSSHCRMASAFIGARFRSDVVGTFNRRQSQFVPTPVSLTSGRLR